MNKLKGFLKVLFLFWENFHPCLNTNTHKKCFFEEISHTYCRHKKRNLKKCVSNISFKLKYKFKEIILTDKALKNNIRERTKKYAYK